MVSIHEHLEKHERILGMNGFLPWTINKRMNGFLAGMVSVLGHLKKHERILGMSDFIPWN
jgi:hypothetical protein